MALYAHRMPRPVEVLLELLILKARESRILSVWSVPWGSQAPRATTSSRTYATCQASDDY